jgi:hypothetical protein
VVVEHRLQMLGDVAVAAPLDGVAQKVFDVPAAEKVVGDVLDGVPEQRESEICVGVQERGEGGNGGGADLWLRVSDELPKRRFNMGKPRRFLGNQFADRERGGAACRVERGAIDAGAVPELAGRTSGWVWIACGDSGKHGDEFVVERTRSVCLDQANQRVVGVAAADVTSVPAYVG